jgi:hypothetical protein
MPVFNRNRHSGSSAGVAAAYTIDNSCRFNSADSAYLHFTPSGAGDSTKISTMSCWIKLVELTNTGMIASCNASEVFHDFRGGVTNYFGAHHVVGSPDRWLQTTASYRDPSAWMHIHISMDTGQATAADRMTLTINGVKITDFRTEVYPAQNDAMIWASAVRHDIGRRADSAGDYLDAYLAEVIFIDGVEENISSFGEFDTKGIWIPVDPSSISSFGTNGWWLDFANSSDLGNDISGNSNDFTSSGLATNDQTTDSPTDSADDDVGNYATWNPLQLGTSGSLLNGNLSWKDTDGSASGMIVSTITMPAGSGKFHAEFTYIATYTNGVGIMPVAHTVPYANASASLAFTSANVGYCYNPDGGSTALAVDASGAGATYTTGDRITLEYDATAGTLEFFKNGATQYSSTSIDTSVDWVFTAECHSNGIIDANFGQLGFTDTPTSGFKALATQNLAAPAITDPSKFFQVDTFTGTGSELVRTLTDAAGGAVKPDLVWIKDRDTAVQHALTDSARGATKELDVGTDTEATIAQGLKSFDTSGYTLGTDASYNASSSPNVAWCWVGSSGAGSSNTDGSINTTTTTVSAASGFSCSTYTGTGSAATIGHGMGIAPEFWVATRRDVGDEMRVYHKDLDVSAPEDKYLNLNSNIAVADDATLWNDTAPTSTLISLGTNNQVNGSSATYVIYAWAGVEGYSKFGVYAGNSSTDGTFVHCGFRPAWIMAKNTASTSNWWMFDTARAPFNQTAAIVALLADTTAAETTREIDILSNGFKLRTASDPNADTAAVFAAFAEFPFGGDGVSQARAR